MHLFGVGVDASLVYQTMIKFPRVTRAELALWFAWPEERLGDALAELEALSLIKPGSAGQDAPVLIDPDRALGRLLDTQQTALSRHLEDMARSQSMAASLVAEYQQARLEQSDFPAHRILGFDAVQTFAQGLGYSCASDMMSFSPGGPPDPPRDQIDRDEDRRLIRRGVRIRRLYLQSIVNDSEALAYARWLVELGGEVRAVPTMPVRMSIYDRKVAIVAIDPQRSDEGIMVLRGTGVVTALCAFFEHAWAPAADLGAPRQRDDDGLTAQEREILRLLADGNTDSLIARKLGISVRTSRRIIADIARRLSARSRFQIGVRAVEAGWLGEGRG